jgi:cytochrome b involved in lipid metabolism
MEDTPQVLPSLSSVTQSTHLAIVRPENENLSIVIRDREYDVTKWKYTHPGGHTVLDKYRNKDATDIFDALHGKESHERLAKMPSKPVAKRAYSHPRLKPSS